MDKQARKERLEHIITREEALYTFEAPPLPQRFRNLAEWAATHLSAADQEWLHQQWQQALERCLEGRPTTQPSPSGEDKPIRGERHEDLRAHGRAHATGLPDHRSRVETWPEPWRSSW
jgi:hypothetical protein